MKVYPEMGCLKWSRSQKLFDVKRGCKIRKLVQPLRWD